MVSYTNIGNAFLYHKGYSSDNTKSFLSGNYNKCLTDKNRNLSNSFIMKNLIHYIVFYFQLELKKLIFFK